MSILVYNSVALPYGLTTDFRHDAVYDEVGGVDRCLSRYDITVQGVINRNYLPQLAPDVTNGDSLNAAGVERVLRNRLMKPRQALSFKFNGTEMVPRKQPGNPTRSVVDARNGPQPQSLVFFELTNETFFFHYRILAHYLEAVSEVNSQGTVSYRNAGNVLYNRWDETASIDACNYTKKTRRGKFMIRSDNTDGLMADEVRSKMAVVSVPFGFNRESAEYRVTPDGLAVEYTIVDQEVFKQPPPPAFKAEGEYLETATRGGMHRFGECRLRLEGSKISKQAELIVMAVTIATAKVKLRAAEIGGSRVIAFPEHMAVRVGMWQNYVDCVCRVMYQGHDGRVAGWAGFTKMNTIVPFCEGVDLPPPGYLDRGTAGLLMQAAAYYDPTLAGQKLGPPRAYDGENVATTRGDKQVNLPGHDIGSAGKFPE